MKILNIRMVSLACLALVIIFLSACKDDEFNVPPASTKADFDYEINTIVINEDEGIEHYEVKLFNKSVLAESYLWDFGNGETSTDENPTVVYINSGKYTIALAVKATNEGLYYNMLTKSVILPLGKQVLLAEDFSSGADFLYEDEWAPVGWQVIDNDGDGYNWYASYRVSESDTIYSLRSQSWTGDAGALTPDNWLITPEINLNGLGEGSAVTFRFTVGITANTPQYRKEHYGVFIAVGSDQIAAFVLLEEETFTEETPRMVPLEREIDISEYAGKIVYLAIRHYNVTDMDRIFLEEVELYAIE
jgi:hypothetical protein